VTDRPAAPGRSIIRLGGVYAEQASEFFAGRRLQAVPRDAASVLLLRPARARRPGGQAASGSPGLTGAPTEPGGTPASGQNPGIEVYLLRRARSMAFAAGASAFPGGSVDPRDTEDEVAWAGPEAAAWGRLLDAPPGLARALVCAAVRETFEESGVLLAGPTASTLVADTSGADWEADRTALLDRSLSLARLLGRRGLVLRSDLLRPWARWITPVTESRRYDTRFFAAALPPGQRTRDVGGEAEQVTWAEPAEAIRAARVGELFLLPPTATCLAGLLSCPDVAAALRAERSMQPVTPVVIEADGAYWLTVPDDVGYPL
jgi:8-oxo-dGTP pyrophosphatase MutT (NUDIX family)